MAKIACITSGLTGIVLASYAIVDRLQTEGHEVISASPYLGGARIQEIGAPYMQLLPATERPEKKEFIPFRSESKLHRFFFRWKYAKASRKAQIKAIGLDQFSAWLDREKFDLVLIDLELTAQIMMVYTKGIPLMQLCQFYAVWEAPGLPHIQSSILPGDKGWRSSKPGIAWSWVKLKAKKRRRIILEGIRTGFTDKHSVLRTLAKDLGFPKSFLKPWYWPSPYTLLALPMLNMVPPAMEFPHAFPLTSNYVGPMIADKRRLKQEASALDGNLLHLLEGKTPEQKIIYCSFSTMTSLRNNNFLNRLIQAVSGQENWIMIIGLGGKADPRELGELPANISVFNWVPQFHVLQQADLSIHYGGTHTINECLFFGTPMLVYSGGRYDWNGNAARVGFHQVGMLGNPVQDDVPTIRMRIKEVLEDGNYATAIRKMQEGIQLGVKDKVMEKVVNGILSKKKRQQ